MAETSFLDLILRLRKQGNAPKETQQEFGGLVRTMADVKASFDLAGQAFGYIQQGLQDTVVRAAEWGDSMGDLAQLTGATVEETSRLASIFELVGMDTKVLESSLKALTKNGLTPNMDTLRQLSAQYQALEDPVKRNEFLFKNFGKAGLEMAEIMGKSAEELDALGRAAQMSGKVIDEETAAAAENLTIEMAKLQQMMEGAQIALGNALIPTLVDAAEGFTNLLLAGGAAALMFAKMTGQITEQEAATRAAALAGGDLAAGYLRDWKPAADDVTASTTDLTTATETQTRSAGALAAETERWAGIAAQAAADAALQERLDDLTGAASDLEFGMKELTTATLFHQAAQGLDADAAYALAESMGLIDDDAAAAKGILDDLRKKLEDGKISTEEYTKQVWLMNAAIGALPPGKTITIEYIEQYRREFNADVSRQDDRQGGAIGDDVSGPSPTAAKPRQPATTRTGAIGDGYAMGGDFVVPPGYPNDTYPLRVTSGERVTVTPASQVTNNYNLNMTTASASLGVRNDFALMRALAGV